MFEYREPRRIVGTTRVEVTGEWRTLHNEELCTVFSSPNIGVIMGDRRGAYRVLVGRPEGKRTLENPGVDGRITAKLIFQEGG